MNYKPLITIVLVIFAQITKAQITFNTPGGNVTINHFHHHYHPHTYYNYGRTAEVVGEKFDYVIVFKNDSTIKKFTRINIDTINTIKIKVKGQKYTIKPTDTKSVTYTSSVTGVVYKGIPNDSTWLFKSEKGRISTYASQPGSSANFIVAFQYGSGAIVKLTTENLRPIIKDNDKAMKYFMKDNLLGAIKVFNK